MYLSNKTESTLIIFKLPCYYKCKKVQTYQWQLHASKRQSPILKSQLDHWSRKGNYCGRLAIRTVALEELKVNFKYSLCLKESVCIYIYLINFTFVIQRSTSLYLWLSLFLLPKWYLHHCYMSPEVIFFPPSFHIPLLLNCLGFEYWELCRPS